AGGAAWRGRPPLHPGRRKHDPGGNPNRGCPGVGTAPAEPENSVWRRAADRGRRRSIGALDRTRAVRHGGLRAHVAKKDVLQRRSSDARIGLGAPAGAPGNRRRGRLVQGERLSRMSTLTAEKPEIATVETPSGKGRAGENFPVGSWLIRRDLRPHVHA